MAFWNRSPDKKKSAAGTASSQPSKAEEKKSPKATFSDGSDGQTPHVFIGDKCATFVSEPSMGFKDRKCTNCGGDSSMRILADGNTIRSCRKKPCMQAAAKRHLGIAADAKV